MNTPEEENNDPVWELLKKSPPAEPSAFFSRNVVREVRQREAERREANPLARGIAGLREWFFATPAGAIALVAAIAIPAVILLGFSGPKESSSSPVEGTAPTMASVTEETGETPVSPVSPGQAAAASEYDPAEEISNLNYLGELMAVNDPSLLDDSALADLLF